MKTSFPNSPNFNASRWRGARLALMSANDPKATVVLPQTITDTDIEAAKVVNVETPVAVVETPTLSAVNMGMTCAALRKVAKARGHVGYSKLKKADLFAMLA